MAYLRLKRKDRFWPISEFRAIPEISSSLKSACPPRDLVASNSPLEELDATDRFDIRSLRERLILTS
jgi:hypothetical protein